tara:strand:- start:496 stop:1044 length:549 start_codon:yes stop_codon:yes gene_type:complete
MSKIFVIIIIGSMSLIAACSNSNEFVESIFCSNIEKDYSEISASLKSKEINYKLNLFYADEQSEHLQGLMCLKNLPNQIDGMLFEYKAEQSSAFWMYETHFPITIIYFDKNKDSIEYFDMKPCDRSKLETDSDYSNRCYQESKIYTPSRKYIFALEISSEHENINEIKTFIKDQKLKLVINY